MGFSIWQLLIVLGLPLIGLIWVLPWTLALSSDKISGSSKFKWFMLSFLFSWIGYLIYYFVGVKPHQDN